MKENIVPFRLVNIATTQFATIDSVSIQDDSIDISVEYSFGINEENRILGCHSRFLFLSNKNTFIILHVSCEFEIELEAWSHFINQESKKITFPKLLGTHLATITVGTARGVLHTKTENTKFNSYFLPTIDVTQSIISDISLDIN
jgi:hypothetical protein